MLLNCLMNGKSLMLSHQIYLLCVNKSPRVRLILPVFIQCQFPEDFNVKGVFICIDRGQK